LFVVSIRTCLLYEIPTEDHHGNRKPNDPKRQQGS
jgi:hypothetical protein